MKKTITLFLVLTCFGCASTRVSEGEATDLFREQKYHEAAELLAKSYEELGEDHRDSLLYLMDIGLSYFSAGEYPLAIKYFQEADRVSEIKDYTSLSKETATLFISENLKDYRAEDFEHVLLSTYLAMSYSMQGKWEDALVEARRVNRKLYLMKTQGKKPYQESAFARTLSSILYEIRGEWDSAWIDLKKAYELKSQDSYFLFDLWRVGQRARRVEAVKKILDQHQVGSDQISVWKKKLSQKNTGELIVIYENGISPEKTPHPNWKSIPRFTPRTNPFHSAKVLVQGVEVQTTKMLEDIEAVAIQNLEDQYGKIIAKKIAGAVAKEVISNQIGKQTKNEGLGAVAKLFFYATDFADLRSWNLLPENLQIARVWVPEGEVRVQLVSTGSFDKILPEQKIQIKKNQKKFVHFRVLP